MSTRISRIEVDADLQGEFEGKSFSIVGSGGHIVIDLPDLYSFLRIIRSRPGRGKLKSDLASLNSLLDELQSSIDLHINGLCVASIGYKIYSPLESLVGFKQFKLRTLAMIRSSVPRFKKRRIVPQE